MIGADSTEMFLRELARQLAADAVTAIGEDEIVKRYAYDYGISPGEVAHVHALLGDIAHDVERWQG